MTGPSVLVTGASGYLGSQVVAALAAGTVPVRRIVALDVREPAQRLAPVEYVSADIRSTDLDAILAPGAFDVVVHLAAMVTPPRGATRAFLHDVEVVGTEHLLCACRHGKVARLIVTSSGAAYGYHPDHPDWITEDAPLRGNAAFAYAHHKQLVEELLARWRSEHPELGQVVFRVGTILGSTVRNQITDLFERRRLLAIRGCDSRFVFAWDQDVVGAIVRAVTTDRVGTYNLVGDGAMTIREIAARMGKPMVVLPAWVLQLALGVLHPLGLSQYGPEQVDFLRYRPVLDNTRLKREFGYQPQLTSAEVFDLYLESRRASDRARRGPVL